MDGSFERYAIIAADKEKHILSKYLRYFYSSCQFVDCLQSLVFVDFTTANKSWLTVHCEHSN